MLHQTIKNQITDALRAKDSLKLETLRGLNALIQNELIATNSKEQFLSDDKALAQVKKSVKQRKDSIEQFEKGGRKDLADKEKKELVILESLMPSMMTREQIKEVAAAKIDAMKSAGTLDLSGSTSAQGKIIGGLMKELVGKADGGDVKAVVEGLLKKD
jgi:uncharacterized protein